MHYPDAPQLPPSGLPDVPAAQDVEAHHILQKNCDLLLKEENPYGFPQLIPIFPPKLVTLDLVDITQFPFLDNDVYFAIVANLGQHFVNPLHLFQAKPQKLQIVGEFWLFYRFVVSHVFPPNMGCRLMVKLYFRSYGENLRGRFSSANNLKAL
jgi:hypothetical protein